MQLTASAEFNLLWASLIIEELTRLGVRHICIAPGSRSTPLTLAAAAQTQAQCHLHFDERGLGFMALGLAKASNAPVVIITTSGTAVANLYPAVIEAQLTQVPLVILSADRPFELIDCGANQAIMQPGIFAHFAEQIALPCADLQMPPAALLSAIDKALTDTNTVVQINCPFREPLYPEILTSLGTFFAEDNPRLTHYLNPIRPWYHSQRPLLDFHRPQANALPSPDTLMRFVHGKGLILVGALSPHENPELIINLAQKIGWPILCDAQSQLRQHPSVLGHGDQLLLQPRSKHVLEHADRLLVIGGRFVSKRIMALINEHAWHSHWQFLPSLQRLDPQHNTKHIWQGSIKACCELPWPRSSSANWALALTPLNQNIDNLLGQHIDNAQLGEAQIIRALAKAQTPQSQLIIANSLPIRLYDMYAPISAMPVPLYSNRGASGIDGLIATACGIAKAGTKNTTLVLGDLSALHDLNSLAIARRLEQNLVIVVLNNDGGSIFNLLHVPKEQGQSTLIDDFYRLPHGLEFGYGAAMFGLAYNQADSLDEFIQLYQDACNYQGTSVIEICISSTQASDQINQLTLWIKQD
ncbi:2-succinyl-5-enolpyruvyl-6-hydroxy-3-cyclohexene-1-carboxylic-acid synthase [Shewanella sp.]|uniref:2-succinyl-5-enolpyruvyl-6-hydroxy-3- cyclohexene-1-carboxylic-acid synthase n=1 Tax=Shewanella sp. TaxID=50422 RepID=UPI0040548943